MQGANCFFLDFLSGLPSGVWGGGGGGGGVLGTCGTGGSFGGLLLDKFLYKEDPPQGSTPYLLYTIFDRKSIPVVHFVLTNGTHFTLYMLCLFNINKYF